MHARPLPHNFRPAASLFTSVEEGLHLRPSSSQCRCVPRRGGTGLLPHINGNYLGGGGTGPPPHSNDEYFGGGGTGPPPHNVGKFLRGAVVTQMGRSGDTMICQKATFCTRVQVGTARDAMRCHATGVWSSRAMLGLGCRRLGRFGDTTISGWLTTCTRVQVVTLGTLCDTMRWVFRLFMDKRLGCRRSGRFDDTIRMAGMPLTTWGRSGDTVVRVSGWLQASFRSTSLGTLCDTMRWCAGLANKAHVG